MRFDFGGADFDEGSATLAVFADRVPSSLWWGGGPLQRPRRPLEENRGSISDSFSSVAVAPVFVILYM